ncbi:SDR family NAD(P)-dependent oxidoreductase [Mesorhizobium xinjiangense]|uniref:SDR family NAD(P)-dependent oxidoreductase n=1 Tax=Mesorhizobium xinjiangense TaxID=2678685 RepID=UPI0012EED5EF|nr:SDR family NAD(P)-dependent oxidoreductase [Mesorhizobium xinjiangense]
MAAANDLKVVAITGGASGIGLATARHLMERGFAPWLLDLKSEALREACSALGLEAARGLACNVTDEVSVDRALADIASECRLAGVVNSAGIAIDRPCIDTSVADFRRIVDVNLTGSFIVARAAARLWLEGGETGSIVHISSISGLCGNKGRSAYGASKGGINTLTMVMANELGPHGIRVNAVAPGPIDTPLARKVHTEDVREQWHKRVPLRRYGSTAEVAGAIAFLMSDDASYVNGQVLAVDGGFVNAGLSQ